MPKGNHKYERKVKKNEKRINNIAIHHARNKGLDAATNTCSAILISGAANKHNKAIMTRSGAIGSYTGSGEADAPTGSNLHWEMGMPWANMTSTNGHPMGNCAEAQMYRFITTRGGNPKHYRITTFDRHGKVNPPCGNCRLWVYEIFGEVVEA